VWAGVVGWNDIRRKELGMGLRKKKSLVDQAGEYVDAVHAAASAYARAAGG